MFKGTESDEKVRRKCQMMPALTSCDLTRLSRTYLLTSLYIHKSRVCQLWGVWHRHRTALPL